MLPRPVLFAACALACLGVAWAIWSVPLVMTNDGPQAVLTAHMESHYDDPGSIYARQFAVGFGLSGRGFSFVHRPIAGMLALPSSLRASQLVVVLATALATLGLSSAVAGRLRWSSLLGFCIAFSWPFYMGFYAFTLSTALGLGVLAFVVSKRDGLSRLEKAAVSTGLLVQLFMHGFAVFVTLALLSAVVIARAASKRAQQRANWKEETARDVTWLAASSVPSIAVLLVMRSGQAEMTEVAASGSSLWVPLSDWAHALPRLAVPGSSLLGALVWAAALAAITRSALRLRNGPRQPEEGALFLGAVLSLVAVLALPFSLPGWQFFSPRFALTGLALSLSLWGFEPAPRRAARTLGGAAAAAAAVALACVWSARTLHQRFAVACADALAGLSHTVPRVGLQLPIVLDANCGLAEDSARREVPWATPLTHFPALFAVAHGGSIPYLFGGPAAVHAFVPRMEPLAPIPPVEEYWSLLRNDPRLLDPGSRGKLLTELAVFGTYYENVLVFGATARDRAVLVDRGYVIDFEQRTFINAHFEPCRVELEIPVHPGDPPVAVRGGFSDHELWGAQMESVAGAPAVRATLRTLCGEVWVSPKWRDGRGRCQNVDHHGRIAVGAQHEGSRVKCVRPAP
ncbi:MAG: hypothetical protein IT377_23355 [Polyangiaceae bacterium]|nr:hypothetical protein [Polyangiaceae bacterium]